MQSAPPGNFPRVGGNMAAGVSQPVSRKKRRVGSATDASKGLEGVEETGAPVSASSPSAAALSPTDGSVMVLGTYDGALLGLAAEDGSQLFGFAPHVGCVKAVHSSRLGRLASGGSDHMVRLYDLGKAVELGELQEHNDSVSCVEFWGITTLVTGSDDGQVCIWRTSDWELLLKFRAHKAAVACIAIHPSGRLMASGGRDRGIRLWDLTRGTSAATLTLDGDPPEALLWSVGGNMLSVLSPRDLVAVNARTGATAAYKDPSSSGLMRISLTAAMFLTERALLLGDGKGDMRILTLSDDAGSLVETARLPGDRARGRTKAIVRGGGSLGNDVAAGWFVGGFSSGRVEVWSCSVPAAVAPEPSHFTLLQSVDTNIRLTSLTVWAGREEAAAAANEQKQQKDKENLKKVEAEPIANAAPQGNGGEDVAKKSKDGPRRKRRQG